MAAGIPPLCPPRAEPSQEVPGVLASGGGNLCPPRGGSLPVQGLSPLVPSWSVALSWKFRNRQGGSRGGEEPRADPRQVCPDSYSLCGVPSQPVHST
jgi:hypothetical protein